MTDRKGNIALKKVFYGDIIPWFAAALFAASLYYGLVWSLSDYSAIWSSDIQVSSINLFDHSLLVLSRLAFIKYGIILAACIFARRSASLATWILVTTLMLIWPLLSTVTPASIWFPNSPVPELMVIIGVLAIGRLAEYAYMRHSSKFTKTSLSDGAALTYSLVAISMIGLNSHFIWVIFGASS